MPHLLEGGRPVTDREAARRLFTEHEGNFTGEENLPALWNVMIAHMVGDGTIAVSQQNLATAADRSSHAVALGIDVLRAGGLLEQIAAANGRYETARYRVVNPPRRGRRVVRDRGEVQRLFAQHERRLARSALGLPLRDLWPALTAGVTTNATITVSGERLAANSNWTPNAVRLGIRLLRVGGLLEPTARGGHGWDSTYRLVDPTPLLVDAAPAGYRWVRDPDEARAMLAQHAPHAAGSGQTLPNHWRALINRMNPDGSIVDEIDAPLVLGAVQELLRLRLLSPAREAELYRPAVYGLIAAVPADQGGLS